MTTPASLHPPIPAPASPAESDFDILSAGTSLNLSDLLATMKPTAGQECGICLEATVDPGLALSMNDNRRLDGLWAVSSCQTRVCSMVYCIECIIKHVKSCVRAKKPTTCLMCMRPFNLSDVPAQINLYDPALYRKSQHLLHHRFNCDIPVGLSAMQKMQKQACKRVRQYFLDVTPQAECSIDAQAQYIYHQALTSRWGHGHLEQNYAVWRAKFDWFIFWDIYFCLLAVQRPTQYERDLRYSILHRTRPFLRDRDFDYGTYLEQIAVTEREQRGEEEEEEEEEETEDEDDDEEGELVEEEEEEVNLEVRAVVPVLRLHMDGEDVDLW